MIHGYTGNGRSLETKTSKLDFSAIYRLFTFDEKFPSNPVEKEMKHDFLSSSSRKFPGAMKHLKS